MISVVLSVFFFFFHDTATTEIYTLSLHDALPIFFFQVRFQRLDHPDDFLFPHFLTAAECVLVRAVVQRSEEHTSELQSHVNLVCRLLLEKKKNNPDCTVFLLSR